MRSRHRLVREPDLRHRSPRNEEPHDQAHPRQDRKGGRSSMARVPTLQGAYTRPIGATFCHVVQQDCHRWRPKVHSYFQRGAPSYRLVCFRHLNTSVSLPTRISTPGRRQKADERESRRVGVRKELHCHQQVESFCARWLWFIRGRGGSCCNLAITATVGRSERVRS